MIKVLYVINSLSAGGAEAMLCSLLENIDRTKFDVLVVSLQKPGYLRKKINDLGIKVESLNLNKFPTLRSVLAYSKILKKYNPDVIHAWMYDSCLFAGFFRGKSVQKKIVMGVHSHLDNLKNETLKFRLVNWLLARLSYKVGAVQYVGKKICKAHMDYGYCAKKSTVISNGFSLYDFRPDKEKYIFLRKKLGIMPSNKIMAMFARYHPMKNHRLFVDVAAIVARSLKNVSFILAGSGCDCNNKDLVELIGNAGLERRISLLGVVSSGDYMPAADVSVLTSSYSESFCMVLCESMACGVPCVSTDVGEAKNIISTYGGVVKINDAKALAGGVVDILNMSKDGYDKISAYGIKHIFDNYSIDKIAEQYQNLYINLLKQYK